jgi:hypothetical protein
LRRCLAALKTSQQERRRGNKEEKHGKEKKKERPLCFCVPPPQLDTHFVGFLAVSETGHVHFGLLMSDMAARIVFVMRLFVGVFEVGVI